MQLVVILPIVVLALSVLAVANLTRPQRKDLRVRIERDTDRRSPRG